MECWNNGKMGPEEFYLFSDFRIPTSEIKNAPLLKSEIMFPLSIFHLVGRKIPFCERFFILL